MPGGAAADTDAQNSLIMQKSGSGHLYFRLSMTYSPKSLTTPAISNGFTIERTYEGDHVKKDQDGVWHFAKGQLVQVHLKIVS